ncbi:dynein regulatory complex protein 9 isoform X4 [Mycteria americana]|uniref:dynein regulatory complex protein 9 isoform X4 n=1 Tax=Mycteria americana TaxID=33587 RepID=UPI003F5890A2
MEGRPGRASGAAAPQREPAAAVEQAEEPYEGAARSKNTETKEMEKLTHLEALLFTAVLENCVDQLSILGYIMPVSHEGKPDLSHTGTQEMKEIIETQKELDINYQELMSARQWSGETVTSMSLKSIEHEQQLKKTEGLKSTHHLSKRATKHTALSVENLRKIQADRQYASDVITVTMKKIQESGTFNSLTEANEREKAKKSKFHDILIREEEGKKEIKSLEKQLQNVKKQTEIELQNRDNMIVYLKDELQEVKAKTNMESCYMKKSTDLQVHQTQKKCSNAENVLDKEIQKLRSKTDEEIRVHMEIENFLRQHHKCQVFEETIISDRVEKEAKRRQLEQDALELKSILKLQAWWRGTMVRRNLGPYQALRKIREKQLSKQKEKGKKEKSGAKKKTR